MSQRRSVLKSHQAETSTSKTKHQTNIHSIISTRTSKNKQTGDISANTTLSTSIKCSKPQLETAEKVKKTYHTGTIKQLKIRFADPIFLYYE